MPSSLGSVSTTLFLKSESHKLHQEFEVATGQTVYKGQPVILTTTGTVQAAADAGANAPHVVIGICIHDGAAGDLVTVRMKAQAITWGEAGTASLNAGPVLYYAYNTTTNMVEVDDASVTAANVCGWALDAATADGDSVRIAWL